MYVAPQCKIVALGESIGTYLNSKIPAWFETADGVRHEYVGQCGPGLFDMNELGPGQSVIAPGLIYQTIDGPTDIH